MFEQGHAASALACRNGAHQAGRAASEDQCVETMANVVVNSAPRRSNNSEKFSDSYQGVASATPEVQRISVGFSRCETLAARNKFLGNLSRAFPNYI
jgi:hypothetical protein